MELQAVFFDAAQTLLVLREPVLNSYLAIARRMHISVDDRLFQAVFRQQWSAFSDRQKNRGPEFRSSESIERQMWFDFTLSLAESFPELAACHGTWHQQLVEYFDSGQAWNVTPGAIEVIQILKEHHIRLAVISNWHSALHAILKSLGLSQCFDATIISSEWGHRKPHRSIFQHALEAVGVEAGAAVHIGDSWHDDILGSLTAGISPIWLRSPMEAPADSRVMVAESMSAVAALLRPRIPK